MLEKKLYISPYLIMVVVLSIVFIWSKEEERSKTNGEITEIDKIVRSQIKDEFADEGFLLVDVRTGGEFNASHCDGAINISCESVGNIFPMMMPRKDYPVFVYCKTGKRAELARENLLKLGYKKVINLNKLKQSLQEKEELSEPERPPIQR